MADWSYMQLSWPIGHWLGDKIVCRPGRRTPPDNSQTTFDDSTQTFDNSGTTWDGKRSPPPPPDFRGYLKFDDASQSGALIFLGMI